MRELHVAQGPQTSSIWDLVRNASSWAPLQNYLIRNPRVGPRYLDEHFASLPGDFNAHSCLRTTDMVIKSLDSGIRLPEPNLAVHCLGDLAKVLSHSKPQFRHL